MKGDIIQVLNEFIPEDNPKKWAKLSSTINSRRLELMLLKGILIELRQLNKRLDSNSSRHKATTYERME
jgi:hypothetical protein